mmetsp:Transcript_123535/g.231092  ORF Transcript_123535/g.231092 Transcript_123535/m.231092 type:complete len:82 (-) Transcript_123535:374-619(-)
MIPNPGEVGGTRVEMPKRIIMSPTNPKKRSGIVAVFPHSMKPRDAPFMKFEMVVFLQAVPPSPITRREVLQGLAIIHFFTS